MTTTNNNKTFKKFLVGVLFIEVNTHGVRGHARGHGRKCGGCCGQAHSGGRWRVHRRSLSTSCTARLGKNSLGSQETIHLIAEKQHSSRLTPFALSRTYVWFDNKCYTSTISTPTHAPKFYLSSLLLLF